MGRVNKAMRRAGGDEAGAGPTTDATESALAEFGLDADLGADKAEASAGPEADLPLAGGDRDDGASAPATDPRADAIVAPAARTNGERPRSLLDRLDAAISEKIVVDDRMLPASKEQYRRLAAGLHRAQEANGLKVVMIASAAPGEGKTLTACNLALTFSESYGRRVLLIDADLRRPQLHSVFGVDGATGLAEGLQSGVDLERAGHAISPRLTVLPAGQANVDPMAGLTSPRMRAVIDGARARFDWVIIDTPPVGLMTDANLLASIVDGALMVVKAGATPYDLVRRASDSLAEHGVVLGVVLNRVSALDGGAGYGYGYGDYQRYYGGPGTRKAGG